MTARILDGKARSAMLRHSITAEVSSLSHNYGIQPGLAVLIVGEDPASEIYVKNKIRQTIDAGMKSLHIQLNEDISQSELLSKIEELNNDTSIHGILVQLPLPGHIDSDVVIKSISPEKDVDGFHPINAGYLATGNPGLVPCTPLGCMILIKDVHSDISGLEALVVGRSNIVGKPVAQLLLQANATVTIAHSRTRSLADKVARADILVAAVGHPGLIKGKWIKPGATVLDVGMNRLETKTGKSRLVGDIDYSEAISRAGAITPVPGGVGPMTIACLLSNTIDACCHQLGINRNTL